MDDNEHAVMIREVARYTKGTASVRELNQAIAAALEELGAEDPTWATDARYRRRCCPGGVLHEELGRAVPRR